eukprot:TRINITY_DN64313_c0_g1_i1.p1 TRINITY_DN64313_c0_g1~~TRINITY_DN64313_c0_g1_i1.p1  ORF type:complete len:218 (-),score=14.70 TRINITY_DN64313_c0_g1_i1:183-836(-)
MFTMRNDKWGVFFPSIATMVVLHLSSVVLGTIFPLLFSQRVIVYFSVVLFLIFGILMLYDAYTLEEKNAQEKITELQEELNKEKNPELKEKLVDAREMKEVASPDTAPQKEIIKEDFTVKVEDSVSSNAKGSSKKEDDGLFSCFFTNPYLHLILLLFVGECGDRTQIAAIVLTATHSAWGVAVGGSVVSLFKTKTIGNGCLCSLCSGLWSFSGRQDQ